MWVRKKLMIGVLVLMMINIVFNPAVCNVAEISEKGVVEVRCVIEDTRWSSEPPSSSEEKATIVPKSTITRNLIAIRVEFLDGDSNYTGAPNGSMTYTQPYFDNIMNNLTNYYQEVSYNQLTINYTVSGKIYTLSKTMKYYGADTPTQHDENLTDLIYDSIIIADLDRDFSKYDDVVLWHAGAGQESDINEDTPADIWSVHVSGFSIPVDGTSITKIIIIPETENQDGLSNYGILGVATHEFGHQLGLPDLYDTDKTSQGIGNWGLMGSGNWLNNGNTPAHLCAWSKIYLGWINSVNLTIEGYYTVNPVENYNDTVYKFPITDTEYFLIEFRKKTGYDSYLPGEGLLIWHIDDNQPNNNNESHKKVDLEEADQGWQTKSGLDGNDTTGDRGSVNDTWKDNLTGFRSTSIPNSNNYANNTTDMSINHISKVGNKMSFVFGSTLVDIGLIKGFVPTYALVGQPYQIYAFVGSNSLVDIYDVTVKFTVSYGGDPQPLPDGNIQLLPAGACKAAESSWYVAQAGTANFYIWLDYEPSVEITPQTESNVGYANVSWENANITKYVWSSDVGDVDADGTVEIVVSNATGIYVFNGKNYSLEWSTEGITAFHDLIWDPAVGNLDDDPALEIVASNMSHVFVIDGINHNIEWDSGNLGSSCRDIVIDDIDGDGKNEIITGTAYWEDMNIYNNSIYHYGNIYIFNISTTTPEWKSDNFAYSILSLNVSDFDNDGTKEIIVGTDNGYVHTYDGKTHASEYSSGFIDYFIDSIVVDDVDDDGSKEMVVGSGYVDYGTNTSYGCVYVYTAGGSLEWKSDILFSLSLVVADPDGDGTKEIVTGTYFGLYAFDAKKHTEEWYYPRRILSLAVGDIDSDTANEIVASDDLYIFGVKQTYTFNLNEGWRLITMPHIPFSPTPYKAGDWADDLSSNCVKIAQWNTTQQNWIIYEKGVDSNNFTIDSGVGYFVYCTGTATWTVAGKLITSTTVNLTAGWNSIGWYNSTPTNAENLGKNIKNCTAIAYWHNTMGRFITHPIGVDISNFKIVIGEGYFVYVTTESMWVRS